MSRSDFYPSPHDGIEDAEFWKPELKGSWKSGGRLGSTPIYYLPHLRKMPERSARVVKAIAEAEPGGVLVHCVSGRDRTGLMVLIVLSLIGVNISDIAEDYLLSQGRLETRAEKLGEEAHGSMIATYLSSQGTSARQVVEATASSPELVALLKEGGLDQSTVEKLRARMLS